MALNAEVKYQANLSLFTDSATPIVGLVRTSVLATGLDVGGVTNSETELDQNTSVPIRVSGTKKYGIIARHIVLYRLAGTSPNQFREYRKVVIFTPDTFVIMLSTPPTSIDYEGITDWILVGGQHERYHLAYSTV
jgi:hypothetical protein